MKSISVVLPNFNGRHLLEKNLPSLVAALDRFPNEIIVVDDTSTDDSVAFLKAAYPALRVIVHAKNQGFSATCNTGLRAAKNELVCISNTDVNFHEDYFLQAVPVFEKNVFAVKGQIKNETSVGEFLNFDTIAQSHMKRGLWRFDKTVQADVTQGFSAKLGGFFPLLGCCFIAQTEQLKRLGGFDEIFSPFYWEDSDLPFRALKAGYELRYVPQAKVKHEASSTINRFRPKGFRKLVSDRNKFIFAWRHMHTGSQWVSHIAFIALFLPLRWLKLDWSYYISLVWAIFRVVQFKLMRRESPIVLATQQ